MTGLDELLKRKEYDIYNNADISEEAVKEIAELITADKSIDLEHYFDLLKCSSKFCWLNYLKILEKMSREDRVRGLPLLFELLQDANWPTYQKTMELLGTIDRQTVQAYLDKYLVQAHEENDEMWISNMQILEENQLVNIALKTLPL